MVTLPANATAFASWEFAVHLAESSWRGDVKESCGVARKANGITIVVVPGFSPPKVTLTSKSGRVRQLTVGKAWYRRSVGQLCRLAFRQPYTEMQVSFDQHGYVPTLRPHSGRSIKTRKYNAIVQELADCLELLGHRVWRGTGNSSRPLYCLHFLGILQ